LSPQAQAPDNNFVVLLGVTVWRADLSTPPWHLDHLGKNWWARQDLNLGPTDYESAALTAELRARFALIILQRKELERMRNFASARVDCLGASSAVNWHYRRDPGEKRYSAACRFAVVGIAAEFDGPLGSAQRERVIRAAPVCRYAHLIINIEIRKDRSGLREWQIQFELAKPHVQGVRRQMEEPAKVVVFQVAVTKPSCSAGASRRKVVVNPEREVIAKASCRNDRKRVRGKQVRAGNKGIWSIGLNRRRRLVRIPIEEA
jgi:hypothetical protein